MNTSVLKPSKWGQIFILLSLDNAVPFYEAMGLRLPAERFQKLLRKSIIENRLTYERQPQRATQLADRVLKEVALHLAEELARHFYVWSTTIFLEAPADQPQWSAWEILVGYSPLLKNLKNKGSITETRHDGIKETFAKYMDLSDVEGIATEIKKIPLSAWDLEMYSIHQYSHDSLSDPLDLILRIVEMNQFQIFWEIFMSDASSREKEALREEGQIVAKEIGLWLPGPLESPDSLRRML